MLNKILIALGILILIVWIVAITAVVIWLLKNFKEYRSISIHNDQVFKEAITTHSGKIDNINETIKHNSETSDEVIKNIDERISKQKIEIDTIKSENSATTTAIQEYQKDLSGTYSKVTELGYKVAGMEVVLNALNKFK